MPTNSTNTTSYYSRLLLSGVICLLASACSTTPSALARYDFGLTNTNNNTTKNNACPLPPINLADITTNSALDSDLMLYRLNYANDQQTQAYALHRWSMPPAQLLTQRIKTQLADQGVTLLDAGMVQTNVVQLRLELDDFSQYFSDSAHSNAQIKLRASLLRGHALIAQTNLQQQAPTNTPDAPSGAQAMRVASDALISGLTSWLCKQTQP